MKKTTKILDISYYNAKMMIRRFCQGGSVAVEPKLRIRGRIKRDSDEVCKFVLECLDSRFRFSNRIPVLLAGKLSCSSDENKVSLDYIYRFPITWYISDVILLILLFFLPFRTWILFLVADVLFSIDAMVYNRSRKTRKHLEEALDKILDPEQEKSVYGEDSLL